MGESTLVCQDKNGHIMLVGYRIALRLNVGEWEGLEASSLLGNNLCAYSGRIRPPVPGISVHFQENMESVERGTFVIYDS